MAEGGESQSTVGFKTIQLFKEDTLGIGSYGAVCKAKCDDLACAAKILHRTLVDPVAHQQVPRRREHRLPLRRFEQECEFMSTMRHPNIVQYLGIYQDPDTGLPVLLMELMDDSLTHFVENSTQPIPYHIQVNICHDIALALSFLHSNDIVHRDLSSNNVLLRGNILAKVTDFGMARLGDQNPRATQLTFTMCPGTDVFMPPEAVRDRPVYSEKIDCFSLGVIVVQTLSRKFPKPGDRLKAVQTNDPQFAGGEVLVRVSEIERRQNHISLIREDHPLLRIACDCLKDSDVDRPSSHELQERIGALKESPEYAESARSEQEILAERDRQIQELREQILALNGEIESKNEIIVERNQVISNKEELIAENNRHLRELRNVISEKDKTISELRDKLSENALSRYKLQNAVSQKQKLGGELRSTIAEKCTELDVSSEIAQPIKDANIQERLVDYKTQKATIHSALQQRLKQGDTWYLVDVKWMKQWKKYVGYDSWDQACAGLESANPGPVENSSLFKDETNDTLRDHLMEELDYFLLPERAWHILTAWYGLPQNSRPIARKVAEHGTYMKHIKVEVYLLEFKLAVHPNLDNSKTRGFSRVDTVGDLEAAIRKEFQVDREAECRVWNRFMAHSYELLPNRSQTLKDAALYNGQTIVLEIRNKDGSWPRQTQGGASQVQPRVR